MLRGWRLALPIGIAMIPASAAAGPGSGNAQVESPVAAGDPRFVDYVASLVGAAVESGDEHLCAPKRR